VVSGTLRHINLIDEDKHMERKKVYLEPAWKLHMGYHVRQLIPFPPDGYEFITRNGLDERLSDRASGYQLTQSLISQLYIRLPVPLMKARWDSLTKKPPGDAILTFASNHLVFRKEPWIADIGRIWEVIGYNLRHFRRYQKVVEEAFASDNCKGVLCWTEFSRNTCLSALDCRGFEHKLDAIPLAVAPMNFTREFVDDRVRLFFIGSANLAGQFELRGGKEVLEAFDLLSNKYNNIELIIRSDISPAIKKRYESQLSDPSVRVIDGFLPWREVEKLYQTSDIFFFPCHYESWQITLEAMSYELPVISIGLEGVSEFIKDGETGYLVPESERVPQIRDGLPVSQAHPQVLRALQATDPRLVNDLVEKASLLIEDKELRRKMGAAGRWQVEHGKNSLAYRNTKLKEVFDRAAGGGTNVYS
jgi:glycosyltransferase involved in cell wall biosynthesis